MCFTLFLDSPQIPSKLDTKPNLKGTSDVTTANNTIPSHLFVTLTMTVSNCTAYSKKKCSVTVTICCVHQECADFQIPACTSEQHLLQLFLLLAFHVLILTISEQCKHKAIIRKVMWLSMRQLDCIVWNKRMFVRATNTDKRHRILKKIWVRRGKETAVCVSVQVCN
jgi:hypothetical protein